MTAFTTPPIDPGDAAELSDAELERELTLATLTPAREPTFKVLLNERSRRRPRRNRPFDRALTSSTSSESLRNGD